VTKYLHKFTELSRYAPYEVDNDEKKQDAFLCGLVMRTSILQLQSFLPLRYLTLSHDHEHNN
jgi:hypothetical protein